MSRNWYELNISIDNAVRSDFDFEQLISTSTHLAKFNWDMWSYRYEELTELFTQDWLGYMKSKNLEISSVLIFYRRAFFTPPEAHIDMPFNKGGELSCPINWVVGEDASDMAWYKSASYVNRDNYLLTPANDKYVTIPMGHLVEVNRRRIGNIPTLVRVDIPHAIIMNEKPRLAISARTKFKTNDWDTVLKYMAPHIKNDN